MLGVNRHVVIHQDQGTSYTDLPAAEIERRIEANLLSIRKRQQPHELDAWHRKTDDAYRVTGARNLRGART